MNGPRVPESLELLFLDGAQKFGLQIHGDVADLVQEEGAAIGQFEAAFLLHQGAGESALLVPEEFALQQPGRYGGAVQSNESPLPTRAQWIARANSSLPVPVSPWSSTVDSVGATMAT